MRHIILSILNDPYIVVAKSLVKSLSASEVVRCLTDDKFIEGMVRRELYDVDFNGPLLDCVLAELLDNRRKVEVKQELNKLAHFFFKNLDLNRLRQEIFYYATKYHIIEV